MIPFHVSEVQGPDGLATLETEWRTLAVSPHTGSYCLDFDWFAAQVARDTARGKQFRFVRLQDERQRTCAIVPLESGIETIRRLSISCWFLAGVESSRDLLCRSTDIEPYVMPVLLSHLRRDAQGCSLLAWSSVVADTTAGRVAAAARSMRHAIGPGRSFRTLDTAEDAKTVMARLPKNLRANLRKAHNKLAKAGPTRFQAAVTPEELARDFEVLADVETRGWKGAEGTASALKLDAGSYEFHRRIATTTHEGHRPRIFSLWIGDRCAAAQLWVRYRNEMIAIKIAYDEEFGSFSPGQALFAWIMEQCCEDPEVRRINLISDQPWHDAWDAARETTTNTYYPLGALAGNVALAMLALRAWVHSR